MRHRHLSYATCAPPFGRKIGASVGSMSKMPVTPQPSGIWVCPTTCPFESTTACLREARSSETMKTRATTAVPSISRTIRENVLVRSPSDATSSASFADKCDAVRQSHTSLSVCARGVLLGVPSDRTPASTLCITCSGDSHTSATFEYLSTDQRHFSFIARLLPERATPMASPVAHSLLGGVPKTFPLRPLQPLRSASSSSHPAEWTPAKD
eukprot:2488631-Pleurochrysis_carterae.AAC.1